MAGSFMFVFHRSNITSENSEELWTLVMLIEDKQAGYNGREKIKGLPLGLMMMMKAMTSSRSSWLTQLDGTIWNTGEGRYALTNKDATLSPMSSRVKQTTFL